LNTRPVDLDSLISLAQARYADSIKAYRMAQQHTDRLANAHDDARRMAATMQAVMDEAQASLRALLT
jgi:hypothetical protein